MLLSSYRPVYSQLVDLLAIGILDGTWDSKVAMPAIDVLAKQTSLNPQAVTKAYARLEELKAICVDANGKRTVAPEAKQILQAYLRKRFLDEELPQLATRLKLMGIDPHQLDWDSHHHQQDDAS